MAHLDPQNIYKKITTIKNSDVLIVDVRTKEEFAISWLHNAINIPLSDSHRHLPRLQQAKHVIAYCNTGIDSTKFYQKAHEAGHTHVMNLIGGMIAWERSSLPIDQKKKTLPIMRQTFLIAWTMILLWVILGFWANPYWLLMSGFVWAGLLFAWATGICAMSKLLAFAPWNKVASCNNSCYSKE